MKDPAAPHHSHARGGFLQQGRSSHTQERQ
jgi:hypothetical protein